MILFPSAKINLGLNVLFKRDDGYHEIETCMYPIPICDVLEIVPSDKFSYAQSGLPIDGETEDNLVVKAFRKISEKHAVKNVAIHLRKNIPMGAGLGGGSADAAYTLIALNELFELKFSTTELQQIAGELGSDCPFFIENVPQIAKGRGELLSSSKVDLKGYYLKLINPEIHVNTKDAYANIIFSQKNEGIETVVAGDIHQWKQVLKNDFEQSIFGTYPEIKKIKERLYEEGAIYSSMTGSGSSVYGIFNTKPKHIVDYPYEKTIKL